MADVYNKKSAPQLCGTLKAREISPQKLLSSPYFYNKTSRDGGEDIRSEDTPDFVFMKERVAIFVDGCFWHGHDCRNTRPKDNEKFWKKKVGDNIERDKAVARMFQSRGWIVLHIWECELKKNNRLALMVKLNRGLSSPQNAK